MQNELVNDKVSIFPVSYALKKNGLFFSSELLLENMDAKLLQECKTLSHSLKRFCFSWTAHNSVWKCLPEFSVLFVEELPHLITIQKKIWKHAQNLCLFSQKTCSIVDEILILWDWISHWFKLISKQTYKSTDLWQNMEKLNLDFYIKKIPKTEKLWWFIENSAQHIMWLRNFLIFAPAIC